MKVSGQATSLPLSLYRYNWEPCITISDARQRKLPVLGSVSRVTATTKPEARTSLSLPSVILPYNRNREEEQVENNKEKLFLLILSTICIRDKGS